MKHKTINPCNCKAYSFPHRLGGGKCSSDMDCEDFEFDEYEMYEAEREAPYLTILGKQNEPS